MLQLGRGVMSGKEPYTFCLISGLPTYRIKKHRLLSIVKLLKEYLISTSASLLKGLFRFLYMNMFHRSHAGKPIVISALPSHSRLCTRSVARGMCVACAPSGRRTFWQAVALRRGQIIASSDCQYVAVWGHL
jgi:hypothetical protein